MLTQAGLGEALPGGAPLSHMGEKGMTSRGQAVLPYNALILGKPRLESQGCPQILWTVSSPHGRRSWGSRGSEANGVTASSGGRGVTASPDLTRSRNSPALM